MIRWLLGPMLRVIEPLWQQTHDEEEIRNFLRNTLCDHISLLPDWRKNESLRSAVTDVIRAANVAVHLGIRIPAISGEHVPAVGNDAPDSGTHVPMPLRSGRLVTGVAKAIELAVETGQLTGELTVVMEKLLRHVEIRRTTCLLPEVSGDSKEQNRLDKNSIAAAFVQFGERTVDLRYLNAAMKLNDQELRHQYRTRPGPCSAKFIWCLALQERAVQKVVQCE